MDPRLRTLLFGLGASALAVWVGVSLAHEELFIATLLTGVTLWAVLSWTRGPRTEAWLLAFLFFAYVIGNRGFAQLAPVPGLPVLFSELGLGFVLVLAAFRGALQRELPLRRDWLNGLLLFWFALAAGRIGWDVRTHGFVALRDFAIIYYVLYFFATQAVVAHAPSRSILRTALVGTFALLPVTGVLAFTFPDFFLNNLLVNGVPLIFYKGDLLATFLFTGYLVMLPASVFNWRTDGGRWLAALVSLVLGLSLLSRAPLVGLLVAIGWMAWSGRWRPLRVLVGVCVAGVLAVGVYSLLQKKDFRETKAYAVYESVASIGDVSGKRRYENDQSNNKGHNNRFRLVWWKNVVEETLATSPVLGLGFGADLAHGFLLEYYPTDDFEFNTRSPHNIFVTTFGRMGILGTGLLFAIYGMLARVTARTARGARGQPGRNEAITLMAACWVVLISACFGVVLEGPMGAIPLWILLGLAYYAAQEQKAGA